MKMGGGLPFSSGLNNDNKSVWGWLEQDVELVQTVRTSSMFFVHRQKLNLYLRFLTSVNALQLEELKLLGSMTNIAQNKICHSFTRRQQRTKLHLLKKLGALF